MAAPDPSVRKPNRAVSRCTRKHRRPMPPVPRGRWDTTVLAGDTAPLDLQLTVARYGLLRAAEILTEDRCLR